MIIHGRKQISEIVYARRASEGGGAIRLTNMIRGGAVVFGGLTPSPSGWGWLTAATVQAIVGAFGDDGYAVIKATNQYLNQLAASDRDKATALAGFINEDPMMVCSLGLEPQGVTMPIRTLNGDSTAYIDTGLLVNYSFYYKMKFISQSGQIFGNAGWRHTLRNTGSLEWYERTNRKGVFSPYTTNTLYEVECGDGLYKVNGTSVTLIGDSGNVEVSSDVTIYNNRAGRGNPKMVYFQIVLSDVLQRDMIPMKLGKAWAAEDVSTGVAQAAGTCGMIDIVSGKFFPNANSSGSFTIPDISYTPSTP